ncbi:hypothetical protein BASA60_000413 [Batrachochytrium salamandrivorans]|nr:hypothetical protein BASA60_000413 [Batrachochytrium salamandrivorans]
MDPIKLIIRYQYRLFTLDLPSSTLQFWHPQQLDAGQSTKASLEVPAPKQTAQATLSFVWTLVIKTEKNRESVFPPYCSTSRPVQNVVTSVFDR